MPRNLPDHLAVGQCATLACALEVTVPKPGNVHRGADFEDVTFLDFLVSSVAIAPAMQRARQSGVGAAVLAAIAATRRVVATNTNLGTTLLLAPLAAVDPATPLAEGIGPVLQSLGSDDARCIYEAIRLAKAGGLGRVEEMDVAGPAPASILEAMNSAAQRDLVARQYTNNFATILDEIVPALVAGPGRGWSLTDTILETHLWLMSRHPDSLIARKCGDDVAQEASARAARALKAGPAGSDARIDAVGDLDFWLRSDHHRRNPGTTADLIAAGLFAALRDARLQPPYG